ncbi:hypothetical protein [Jiangella asiatica]|uniref:Uncharacterized protein n=1 Tax=Jiangella asiatica TaxID=2530372 RepID=A0A4R5D507_9ACTN|nr:hypothetical protein [Jiangella asiatica]TDE08502.1 hypothetical protein E1269_17555 [Jiangella asiatica]
MTDHDGAQPTDGAQTAPDELYTLPDQFEPPPVETRPLEIQPDYEILPDRPDTGPPDGCFPDLASREELEMALRRAQLVMDDCETLLDPAIRAMEDGAWVSRLADEFSNGLTTHARLAGTIAGNCVDLIQEALENRGSDDVIDARPM